MGVARWSGRTSPARPGKARTAAPSSAPSSSAPIPGSGRDPWLLLEAKQHAGSGAFSTITHIQRLDTAGGAAPTEGCDADHAGEEVRAPYTATYAFYYPAVPATPSAATPAA